MARMSKPVKKIKKAKDVRPKIAELAFSIDAKIWRVDYSYLDGHKFLDTVHTICNLPLYKTMMDYLGTTEADLEEWKVKARDAGKVEQFRTIKMGEIPMFAYSDNDQEKFEIAKVTIASVHGPREVTVSWPVTELFGKELKDHQEECEKRRTQQFQLCHDAFVKEKKIEILETALEKRDEKIETLIAEFQEKASVSERILQQERNQRAEERNAFQADQASSFGSTCNLLARMNFLEQCLRNEHQNNQPLKNTVVLLNMKLTENSNLHNDAMKRSRAAWSREKAELEKKVEGLQNDFNDVFIQLYHQLHCQKSHPNVHQNLLLAQTLPLNQQVFPQTGVAMLPQLPITPVSPANMLNQPLLTTNPIHPMNINVPMNVGLAAGQGASTSQGAGQLVTPTLPSPSASLIAASPFTLPDFLFQFTQKPTI